MTYSFYRAFGVTLPVLSMVVTGPFATPEQPPVRTVHPQSR